MENEKAEVKSRRAITASENGKLGGRPLATATLVTQKMKEELALAVKKNFKKIYMPQLKRAMKGDFEVYKDIMDRLGIRVEEPKGPGVIVPVQVNIGEDRKDYSIEDAN